MYAYDIERMEPICAEVFPGNSIDASSYPAFIRDNNIQRGIIVADKGFPPSMIQSELSERPDLHFLTPIKRNDSRIANNDMLAFDGVLDGINAHVVYRKRQITPGRFLYSFKDVQKAANEESAYLSFAKKKNNFSSDKYLNFPTRKVGLTPWCAWGERIRKGSLTGDSDSIRCQSRFRQECREYSLDKSRLGEEPLDELDTNRFRNMDRTVTQT